MAVDDQPANLKLLEDLLSQQGHVVRSFPRGRLALEAATRNPPDLILLDINMPEMSGFKVCELLKSDQKLAAIPVIFLSALNDASDKVQAFPVRRRGLRDQAVPGGRGAGASGNAPENPPTYRKNCSYTPIIWRSWWPPARVNWPKPRRG